MDDIKKNDRSEESETPKSFAQLLDENPPDRDWLQPGEKIEAIIVKITDEWIFIDLGGKSEGYLDRKELLDENGRITVKDGDSVTAYFLSSRNNEKLFTTRIGAGDSARVHMEDAWRTGIPVQGTVEKEVKGGFEVRVAGDLRGFCPFSQMGLSRVEDPKELIGRKYFFKILEYGEKGRNMILSSRVIQEEERRKAQQALKETLQEGMRVSGKVVSLCDFGAFVDIGGVQGLLPISEVSWDRVTDIREVLTVGQELIVSIRKLDTEKDRITLSLKETLADPWENLDDRYPEGSIHNGKVVRLTKFGAFVTIAPGVDGLIHISKLGTGKKLKHPGDVMKEGETLEVKIESVDKDKKRLSLVPAASDSETAPRSERVEDYHHYLGGNNKPIGTLGDILKSSGLAGKRKK